LAFGPGGRRPALSLEGQLITALVSLAVLLVTWITSLFAQAATFLAVSDLYLNRPVSVAHCLRRAWNNIGTVFGVGILSALAILAGLVALIVGSVYVFCRLFVALPAALVEERGPADALSRSWRLTQNNAGRAFVIILLYTVIAAAIAAVFDSPLVMANIIYKHNFAMLRIWTALAQIGNTIGNIVISPILLIATSIFYFDLRVRKEGFDLQMMLDPNSERVIPPSAGPIPSILS
jgi:hypothetical protein